MRMSKNSLYEFKQKYLFYLLVLFITAKQFYLSYEISRQFYWKVAIPLVNYEIWIIICDNHITDPINDIISLTDELKLFNRLYIN